MRADTARLEGTMELASKPDTLIESSAAAATVADPYTTITKEWVLIHSGSGAVAVTVRKGDCSIVTKALSKKVEEICIGRLPIGCKTVHGCSATNGIYICAPGGEAQVLVESVT